MALDLRLQHKMSQQLVMTPQLQQAIKLLQLSHLEIADVLREEIEQNPVLEEQGPNEHVDEHDHEPGGVEHQAFESGDAYASVSEPGQEHEIGPGSIESDASEYAELGYDDSMLDTDLPRAAEAPLDATPVPDNAQVSSDVDWENYADSHSYALPGSGHNASDHESMPFETLLTKPISLIDHLRWQVQMGGFAPDEQAIALLLIEEINADGYLNEGAITLIEDELDCSTEDVEHVLYMLQDFDPKGVAARDLRECLTLQARHLAGEHPTVHAIIDRFLPQVERRDHQAIARSLKVHVDVVTEAVQLIKHLEPRPGCVFYDTEPQYITPDIYVHKVGPLPTDYVVTLNEDGLPRLRISHYYRDAVAGQMQGEAKQYIQEKYRSAAWLIRSIHMRQRTIYRVMQSILRFQMDFFEQGVQALKPLILRDVAEDVDMHESTISRVTTNKYVHTPQGIYELKYFFNSSIRGTDGDSVASESVRNHIERLIATEDPKAPHSDQRIVQILKVQDIDIARRTVAKYREMLKIPSSSRRRRVY